MKQQPTKPREMQLSFSLDQMTIMITNCTISVNDGQAIVLASLPWSHYNEKLQQHYPVLIGLSKNSQNEFLVYDSEKRVLLLIDNQKPQEHNELRKIMKEFVSQLDPNIMKLVIPYLGYLDKAEMQKEIKIYFEEAVHMATDKIRPVHVILSLPEPEVFKEAKSLFQQFMKHTLWQT